MQDLASSTGKTGPVTLLTRIHAMLRALTGCQAGAVAIEMALVAPILIFVFMGGFDFGMAFCETHRYASAARAGAQHTLAFAYANVPLPGGMTAEEAAELAAENEYLPCIGEGLPEFTAVCWCPDPEGEICECGLGGPMYISVTVAGTRDLFFNYPGVPNPLALSETALIRLR
jgi:hypothetical protein